MEREEGEMSDDNAMAVDDENEKTSPQHLEPPTVVYKAQKCGIIVEKLEKVDAEKLEERARRFGLNLSGSRMITQKQVDELYTKAGIESHNERHFRFDTLHLNGIECLTTREIFEYLEDYKPVSLEKIDDVSCNIVCQDHISAALALLVHSREIKNENLVEMLSAKSQHHWREGMPHPKKDFILMRFATNGDKKVPKNKTREEKHPDDWYEESMDPVSKNPWGDLCKSWGVYDQQEVFHRRLPKHDSEDDMDEEPVERVQIKNKDLAMRLGKRQYKVGKSEDEDSSDSEWKKRSKTPRMRMHADDEESKQKKYAREAPKEKDPDEDKDGFAPLSIEVVNTKNDYTPRETTVLSEKFKKYQWRATIPKNIQSRLGVKVVQSQENWSDEDSSDDSEYNVSSQVQKVSSLARGGGVWSRLDTTSKDRATKDSGSKDLRQMLQSKGKKSDLKKNDDLRGRLSKAKQSNLRIEIDNS